MSVVDERVVEMQFNNQRFERNVKESISTLDKLKAALKFDGASKGIEEIEQQARGVNFNGISSAVETISNRFTSLGVIATTILQDIGHQAFLAGQRILNMVNSLTVDQISSGWDKYARKTEAVQTIMAATAESWEKDANNAAILTNLIDQGMTAADAQKYASVWQQYTSGALDAKNAAKDLSMTQDEFIASLEQTKDAMVGFDGTQMEYVNELMSKLNWFTDETSYNFTDMVSNIGKFTSNGIALSKAVTSMQGIATWAAMSGANATTASSAMYQLSQAMGMGAVKVQDWQSIETANMSTTKFKETVIDTAVAMGTLKRNSDGTVTTLKGLEVTATSFRSTLAEGWFTSEVLVGTLDKYGAFTNELYKVSEASGLTATELLSLTEAAKDGAISEKMLSDALGEDPLMSVDDLAKSIEVLASDEYDLGYQALKAAQEAKTFQEAIDSVKDAASTMWMNIFENIFGDYEKARHIWTDFANYLYDIFVTPLERIEELSEILGELEAVTRIASVFSTISNYLFNGSDESEGILGSLRKGFEEVIPPLEITEEQIDNLLKSLEGFASSLELTDEQIEKLKDAGAGFANILKIIWHSLTNAWAATEPLRTSLVNLASAIGRAVLALFGSAKDLNDSGAKFEWLRKICEGLASVIDFLAGVISGLDISGLSADFSFFSGIIDVITGGLKWLGNKAQGILNGIVSAFNNLKTFLLTADWASILKTALISILGVIGLIKIYFVTSALTVFHRLKEFLTEVADTFWSMNLERLTAALKHAAIAIGILALALLVLSYVDYEKAAIGIIYLATVLIVLYATLESISKTITGKQLAKMSALAGIMIAVSAAMLVFAIALSVLAGALALFTLVANMEGIEDGLAAMFITLTMVVAAMYAMSKVSAKVIIAASALVILAGALLILAAALAAFTLIAKMGGLEDGLAAMFITLTMVVAAMYAMSKVSAKVIIAASALVILAGALLILAAALAAFTLIAKMDTVWEGFKLMAASLGAVIIALFALSQLGPMVLAGAGAMLIGAAALLVMAGAMAAFAAIAGMESAWTGVGILATMLILLVAALAGLAVVGPMVLVGAAALLVAAAACIALAAAVGVVGLALPLLGMGLNALAQGIASGVIALSGAVAVFGQDLGTAIEGIGSGLGGAIDAIGEGLASAIENIVASVGRGIGDGITAIASGVNELSNSISGVGSSISEFGNGVRSLGGISWADTALGIAEFANAIKKVKGAEAIAEVLAGIATVIEEKVSEMMTLGEKTGAAFVSGITRKNSVARVSGTALAANARAGVASSPSWDSLGSNFAQGFINGIDAKKVEAYTKGRELAASAETGIRDESDMASPSKVARKLGAFYGDGFVLGIASRIEDAYDISADMVHATTNALGTAQKLISNVLEDDFTPVITPILDLSNVPRGLGMIGGLNISSGIYGASTIANSNVGASFNSDYSTDIQTLISLNRELLAAAKAGGNVYLDGNVIAGSVNSRLGLL